MKAALPCIVSVLALASFGAVLGCGADVTPAPPIIRHQHHKAKAPTAATETTPQKAEYIYAYNPLGKRDPFRSPAESGVVKKTQMASCDDPLCQWDLDQLTLVAVITGQASPVAMVQDPHGIGYIVHRHSRMGKRSGRVTQILRNSITVTEYFAGPDGKSKPNPVVLAVKQDTKSPGNVDLFTGKLYP